MDTTMIPLNPHICSKSKCTREIPPDDPNKTCSKCQEADRLSKARKRKREEEPNHVGPTPPQFRPGSATGNGPSILELPDESEVGEEQFTFIDVNFQPPGTPDPTKFEGGVLLEADKVPYDDNIVPSLSIQIPSLSQITAVPPSKSVPIRDATSTNKPLMIKIKLPTGHPDDKSVPAQSQVFCPTHLHDVIVQMVEQHFCAHPLIPGYCYPSPAGICQWAVKQMYKFCEENDLPELWAYMWENWYWRGQWELWACAAAPDEILQLKPDMPLTLFT
ncbi:hypothetical protein EDC04DRAFT_3136464 [Pisolithus marmoratus]|nr:hypothetical protein EDC04DRAFT_3136464 [Pisolithus marmoratus]